MLAEAPKHKIWKCTFQFLCYEKQTVAHFYESPSSNSPVLSVLGETTRKLIIYGRCYVLINVGFFPPRRLFHGCSHMLVEWGGLRKKKWSKVEKDNITWICLRLPSCSPWFKSQAQHLRYFQFIFELWCEKDANK